ncbi:MAG: c-type cytochrome domain-containing protein, partial [Chitinophagaceae bacterium]
MTRYRIILSNIVFSLQLMLLLLLLFYHQLIVPEWLIAAGRFHPLLLHIPITLLLLLMIILLFRSQWKHLKGFDELYGIILIHAVLFATITAISGILLSTENAYDTDLLNRHRWLGGASAIFSYLCWLIYMRPGLSFRYFQVMMILSTALIVTGSHNGGILTHGEDFLIAKPKKDLAILKKPATDSSSIYETAIQPLLEARCYSCHNDKKAKGNLNMTQIEKFLKGGKEGIPWKPGEPENSLLLKRLLLDAEDKKHMPPKGKTPLSETEIALLHQWIGRGASFDKAFLDYPANDSFRIFASSFTVPTDDFFSESATYTFKAADPDIISKLNNPYRSITPGNKRSPALLLAFYVSQQFKTEMLEECKPIRQQVVSINLSKMPLKDEGLKMIAQFENLEELIL